MNKTKKAMGYYLTIAAAVLAIVGALLYGSVMYKLTLVYGFLAAAIVLGVVTAVFAGKNKLVNIIPIINGAIDGKRGSVERIFNGESDWLCCFRP